MKPKFNTIQIKDITLQQIEEIWDFHKLFFNRDKDEYIKSFKKANEVVIGRDKIDGKIKSLVILQYLSGNFNSNDHSSYKVIHGLWFAIDSKYRGKNISQNILLKVILKHFLKHPLTPLYYLTCSSTYLTYLFLTNNFASFWPKEGGCQLSGTLKEVALHCVDVLNFKTWDANTSVIKRDGRTRYNEGVCPSDSDLAKNKHIRYYISLNKNAQSGDTLLCILPLDFKNIYSLFKKVLQKSWICGY